MRMNHDYKLPSAKCSYIDLREWDEWDFHPYKWVTPPSSILDLHPIPRQTLAYDWRNRRHFAFVPCFLHCSVVEDAGEVAVCGGVSTKWLLHCSHLTKKVVGVSTKRLLYCLTKTVEGVVVAALSIQPWWNSVPFPRDSVVSNFWAVRCKSWMHGVTYVCKTQVYVYEYLNELQILNLRLRWALRNAYSTWYSINTGTHSTCRLL
jgi:hypothetical protein